MPNKRKQLRLRTVFLIALFFSTLYITWRLLFTIPFGESWPSLVLGILLIAAEIVGWLEYILNFEFMSHKKNYPLPVLSEDSVWPDVDIFIATYNESTELLYKTINGCRHMRYPDPQKVHIYLCDDGGRNEMRELAERMGIHYLARSDRAGAKAGNLNHALQHSSSPYVVTFDADMIPRSGFLLETMPYFIKAEETNAKLPEAERIEMGFLQTPQSFYNFDLFQYHLYAEDKVANEQDHFYRNLEVAKTYYNAVIYGGSNTVLSRKALEAAGGFYTKAITEDFATGMLIEGAGYVSLATGKPLASGLAPEDFPSLIQQRVRWGRGCINVFHNIHFFRSPDFSWMQKWNYWSAISYWLAPVTRMLYFLVPILAGLFGLVVVRSPLGEAFLFWIPQYLASSWAISQLSERTRTAKWTNIYDTILFPFLFWPILLELFGFELKTFKVTDKGARQTDRIPVRFLLPFVVLFVLTLLAIISVIHRMLVHYEYGSAITLFWLIYNVLLCVISFMFLVGRHTKSRQPLARTSMAVDLLNDDGSVFASGAVQGASEDELEVVWNVEETRIPTGDGRLRLSGSGYTATLNGQLHDTRKEKGLLVSRIALHPAEADEYESFLMLLHDHYEEGALVRSDSSFFDDIGRWLNGRTLNR